MGEFQIGCGQIRLRDLQFELGRDFTDDAVRHLVPVMKHQCNPHMSENYIPVMVFPTELYALIESSGTTLEALSALQPGPYPKLTVTGKIKCLHGRQRYEAAFRVHGPQMWWTVKIFCIPAGSDPTSLLRREIEQHHFQTPPSDGEVFAKVRFYEKSGQPELAADWRLRLSRYKNRALDRLLGRGLSDELMADHQKLVDALDQLLVFPGLWHGLELGNVEKLLALHIKEEMTTYLNHVYSVWSGFTFSDPIFEAAVDVETVEKLQLRAPRVSSVDHDEIKRMMRSRLLFRRVSDFASRQKIEARILQTDTMIPSIRTFHENTSYLGIGMTIIKSHIIGGIGRGESVYQALLKSWQNPSCCLLEHHEGHFQETTLAACPRIAYQQLVIAALRRFNKLSNVRPRCERGENPTVLPQAQVDLRHLGQLFRCAQSLGFNSQHIQKRLAEICEDVILSPLPMSPPRKEKGEAELKRRCGRPFTASFEHFAQHLFLPQLVNLRCDPSAFPTTLFVQKTIICAFFKNTPGSLPRYAAPSTVLNSYQAQALTMSHENAQQSDMHLPDFREQSLISTFPQGISLFQGLGSASSTVTTHRSDHTVHPLQNPPEPAPFPRDSRYRTLFCPQEDQLGQNIAKGTIENLSWHESNEVDLGQSFHENATPQANTRLSAGRTLFDPDKRSDVVNLGETLVNMNDQMLSSAAWAQHSRRKRRCSEALSSNGRSEAASFALSARSIWKPSSASDAPHYVVTGSLEGSDIEEGDLFH